MGTVARVNIRWIGRIGYEAGLELQQEVRERVVAGEDDECLLLEHDPVVTLGKRGGIVDRPALEQLATPVIATDRGGFATWHGPGQLVAYPIVDTRRLGFGVRDLVTRLGEVMIGIARGFGVDGVAYDLERPGVYVGGRKLGSIGLHLSHGVSTHGMAINVCNTLAGFAAIDPCSLSIQVTTIALESGRPASVEHAVELAEPLLRSVLRAKPS